MVKQVEETEELGSISPLHKRNKQLKKVKFQLPGTRKKVKRDNLERHLKAFPGDEVARHAFGEVADSFGYPLTDAEQIQMGRLVEAKLY